jgi:hypothetical protein
MVIQIILRLRKLLTSKHYGADMCRVFGVIFIFLFMTINTVFLTSCVSQQKMKDIMLGEVDRLTRLCIPYKGNCYDFETNKFCVLNHRVGQGGYGKAVPANVPIDAIEYALTEYGELNRNYKHYSRIAHAIKLAILKDGEVIVYCIDDNGKYYFLFLAYEEKSKHLILSDNLKEGTLNAVDLSNIDVSISKQ